MFEAKSKEIHGINFKVVPFPAVTALRLKVHLLKILGPAFGRLLGSFKGIGKGNVADAEIDGAALAGALEELFAQVSENEFIDLLQKLFSGVSCELKSEDKKVLINFGDDFETKMDLVFQGKLFTIYPVILFVLEVNFPDFFGQMAGIGNRMQTMLSKLVSINEQQSQTE